MPQSTSSRWGESSPENLGPQLDSVNESSPKSPGKIARFTPHFSLIPFVRNLRATRAAREVLVAMLWRAGRRGVGADVRQTEAMFWRKINGLAGDAGVSRSTVKRATADLERVGVVRTKLVAPLQKLPDGQRANAPVCVYFVDVERLAQLVGLRPGTHPARGVQIEPLEGFILDSTGEPKNRGFGPPA